MAKLLKNLTNAKLPGSGGIQYYIPESPQAAKAFEAARNQQAVSQTSAQTVSSTLSVSASSSPSSTAKASVIVDVTPKESFSELDKIKSDLEKLQNAFYKNNFSTSQDFPKYSRFNSRIKLPTYATAPTICEIGELYVNSGTGKLYVCTASNTWSLVGTQS